MLIVIKAKEASTLKKLAGISLLVLGSIILLVKFGHFLFFLLAGVLAFFGVKKLKQANSKEQKYTAYVLLSLAGLLFLFYLPAILIVIISGALLYCGWKFLNRETEIVFPNSKPSKPSFGNSFDSEWQTFVDKHSKNN